MKRYTVTRLRDSMGATYATGPLTFIDTDSLAEAQRHSYQNGGEVIDHHTRNFWHPEAPWWEDASEYLSTAELTEKQLSSEAAFGHLVAH